MKVYTDGSCKGNPGFGGWAFATLGERVWLVSGSAENTTNNRMELTACIEALQWVADDCIIFTDSQYVKNGITKWVHNWKKYGWKTSNKQPVKNKDLWIKLDSLCQTRKVEWQWVKAHSTDEWNILVDEEARKCSGVSRSV